MEKRMWCCGRNDKAAKEDEEQWGKCQIPRKELLEDDSQNTQVCTFESELGVYLSTCLLWGAGFCVGPSGKEEVPEGLGVSRALLSSSNRPWIILES